MTVNIRKTLLDDSKKSGFTICRQAFEVFRNIKFYSYATPFGKASEYPASAAVSPISSNSGG